MMIEIQKPVIVRVAYHQDHSDKDYGSCLWAYYDFDLDGGILTVQSDCGYYYYRWPERGNEFLCLMARVHSDYLEEKLLMSVNKPGKPQKAWVRRVAEIYEEHIRPIVRQECEERKAVTPDV